MKNDADSCRSRAAMMVGVNEMVMNAPSYFGAAMPDAVGHRYATPGCIVLGSLSAYLVYPSCASCVLLPRLLDHNDAHADRPVKDFAEHGGQVGEMLLLQSLALHAVARPDDERAIWFDCD